MVRYSRSLVVVAVTAALVIPASLAAQTAVPRPSSGSSSSGGGSSSGGSGGSGEASSRGGSTSSRVAPPSMPSFPTDSRRPSGSASSGSSRSGSSTSSRGGRSTGDAGDGYVGPGTERSGSAVSRQYPLTGGASGAGAGTNYGGSRSRGDRAAAGTAIERPFGSVVPNYNLYFPYNPFSPWGRWYPWYYGGFGYGYVSFDPWRYGVSRYSMYRYGSWYNPYDPWCYGVGYWLCDPWGGATTASYGGSARNEDEDDEVPMASVRLRVSPASAKVYVDGALVGTVDDFDGLSDHLKLTLDEHVLEIKADGYETFVPKLDLTAGKTTTIRGALKKQ